MNRSLSEQRQIKLKVFHQKLQKKFTNPNYSEIPKVFYYSIINSVQIGFKYE